MFLFTFSSFPKFWRCTSSFNLYNGEVYRYDLEVLKQQGIDFISQGLLRLVVNELANVVRFSQAGAVVFALKSEDNTYFIILKSQTWLALRGCGLPREFVEDASTPFLGEDRFALDQRSSRRMYLDFSNRRSL